MLPQELSEVEPGARCDRCSARALVHCSMPFGVLYFCLHHYNEHAVVLTKQGAVAKLLTSKD